MNADSKLPSFSDWTAQIQQRTEVALTGVLPDPAVAPQRLDQVGPLGGQGLLGHGGTLRDGCDDLRGAWCVVSGGAPDCGACPR